jgi:hypothetical protein
MLRCRQRQRCPLSKVQKKRMCVPLSWNDGLLGLCISRREADFRTSMGNASTVYRILTCMKIMDAVTLARAAEQYAKSLERQRAYYHRNAEAISERFKMKYHAEHPDAKVRKSKRSKKVESAESSSSEGVA